MATARAGAAAAAISGPDVETATIPTAIRARSRPRRRPRVLGRSAAGRGCPLDDPRCGLGTGASWATPGPRPVARSPRDGRPGRRARAGAGRGGLQEVVPASGSAPWARPLPGRLARLDRRRRARRERWPRATAGRCPGRRRGRRHRAQQGHRRPRRHLPRRRPRPRAGRRGLDHGRPGAARQAAERPGRRGAAGALGARVTGPHGWTRPTGWWRGRVTSRTGRTPREPVPSTGDDARTAAVHRRPPRPPPLPLWQRRRTHPSSRPRRRRRSAQAPRSSARRR